MSTLEFYSMVGSNSTALKSFAFNFTRNTEDAEECLMNGYLKIFKGIGTFNGENIASFYGWMKRIMINECLMMLRKKNEFLFIEMDDSFQDISIEPNVLEEINAKEMYVLIQELPAGYKSIINLYVVDQMSHKEIATLLFLSESTIKNHRHNMIQKLNLTNEKNSLLKWASNNPDI
mgnify:CR=1 FL=1